MRKTFSLSRDEVCTLADALLYLLRDLEDDAKDGYSAGEEGDEARVKAMNDLLDKLGIY